MTARPMTEGLEEALEAARRILNIDDGVSDEDYVEHLDAVAVATALLSTSASVRGMREALEEIAKQTPTERMSVDEYIRGDFVGAYDHMIEIALSALSGIETGDEQARPAASAPISTDTKGATK